MRWRTLTLLIAALACSQEGRSRVDDASMGPGITLDTTRGAVDAHVVVSGLSSSQQVALRSFAKSASDEQWEAVLRVAVAFDSADAGDSTLAAAPLAIAGHYTVRDGRLDFAPRFAFDRGRRYSVRFDAGALDSTVPGTVMQTIVSLPTSRRAPHTSVVALWPGNDTVPENLLRLYLEFSAPMSRTGGLPYVSLRDDRDREVPGAFLPLDADFWNAEHTRYTLFLDPGRVKRGILPNEAMGRAILAGRRYSIVVDSTWRDADGLPLTATFRKAFAVRAPDEQIIDLAAWKIDAPRSNTRDALTVRFPKPLDHGLLARALGVQTASGTPVEGETSVSRDARTWRFTPAANWSAGDHRLLVLSILEDPAGNRIDGPFEVDVFERVDRTPAPEQHFVPFRIP